MAHYLFLKNDSFMDFKFQSKTIEETINMLVDNQMDVQIHIHSQWCGAEIIDNKIYVSNKWNIGQLKPDEQRNIFEESYTALNKILSKKSITQN